MTKNTISLLSIAIAAIIMVAGCEKAENSAISWNTGEDKTESSSSSSTDKKPTSSTDKDSSSSTDKDSSSSTDKDSSSSTDKDSVSSGSAGSDAVPYSSLVWKFANVNASGAKLTSAKISNLKISKGGLTYSWAGDTLSSWGISNGDHTKAYACLFVKKSDGTWVGGKFDWVSTSRTSRDFENITGRHAGYGGWTLSGVPNPCEAAFVIVSADKKKRTNVIKSTWAR